jgi:uncharacterized protein YqgC (DUF456 family)
VNNIPDWLATSIYWITLIIMGVGLFGLVVPIFPGIGIIWLSALGYGLITGFNTLGWILFALITILFIIGAVIDNVLMTARAHKEGASWITLLVGIWQASWGRSFPPSELIAFP